MPLLSLVAPVSFVIASTDDADEKTIERASVTVVACNNNFALLSSLRPFLPFASDSIFLSASIQDKIALWMRSIEEKASKSDFSFSSSFSSSSSSHRAADGSRSNRRRLFRL